MRVGFIGLGNIGMPMAKRLVEAGLATTAYDLVAERVAELVALGATAATSPRELATGADVIGVCVRDDADVRAVVFGDDGILAGAAPGAVVALHGTVQLGAVLALGDAFAARGIGLVDACVTGGAAGAAAGTLTTMVGGAAADVAKVRPELDAFSRIVVATGKLGSGTIVKLCNNLMGYLAWTAAIEGFRLARAAGITDEVFETVTRAGGHLTEPMQTFLRTHKLPDAARRDPALQARLRSFVEMAEKDLAAALALARTHGLDLPGTELCSRIMGSVYGVIETPS
ncbi:MAG TPA: NAD(P)-dependent oxidoreductase [Candidatus Eisenbacteria bacterium]|nr:NAD(P)-dependent oxidoreductase [Candidatus Eisenbacteria bacterium]